MKKVSESHVQYLLKSHEDKDDPRPLYRAVLFEEYYVLTGDALAAMVLNQFVYWSQRTNDFDKFIKEENTRRAQEGDSEIPLSRGWIYKTSDELSKEIMISSESSVRRAIITLVEKKWLSERNNPNHKWDRTLQYRVNLIQLSKDLAKLGYCVPGYKADLSILQDDASKMQGESSKTQGDAALPDSTLENSIYSTVATGDTDNPNSPPDEEQSTGKELVQGNYPIQEGIEENVQKGRSTGLPKSITGYGDTKPAKAKHQKGFNWGIATAIAKVCQMDFDANKKYLLKEASTLMESKNPEPTKQIILDKYGKGGWWYTSDWRGKQGQAPNPSTLRKEWGKWNGSEKQQITVNPDGSLYA